MSYNLCEQMLIMGYRFGIKTDDLYINPPEKRKPFPGWGKVVMPKQQNG